MPHKSTKLSCKTRALLDTFVSNLRRDPTIAPFLWFVADDYIDSLPILTLPFTLLISIRVPPLTNFPSM